ncbi:hypothetical protein [Luteimonas sp. FCS-9]|uniref:hypothetical protein n=1 Tax=Luteimonas sp. FCS-9 TaxID=1547516 RepID=UPI00063EC1EE|nr:hypothetical protein [Luteimonas sp. FCS-9]KLJ01446.1 hypothetical protein WQ56_06775 [Luteimonas sp. FCS-9]
MPGQPTASPPALDRLVALLRADDVDGAIDAGLMAAWPEAWAAALDDDARRLLLDARARLQAAWDARARYRIREARLARRAAAREAARAPAPAAPPGPAAGAAPPRPALPASAAAILARAKARAGGGA